MLDFLLDREALQRQLEYERIQFENEIKRLMEEVAQEKVLTIHITLSLDLI